jgi:hypothetical protein
MQVQYDNEVRLPIGGVTMKQSILYTAMTTFLLFAVPAFAQSDECSSDADCPDGFTCESSTYEICTDCEPGTDCTGGCEPQTESYCVPPPPPSCDADNPCSGDDVCVTFTFEECSAGGSTGTACPPDPDEPCEEPNPAPDEEPTECTTKTESYCVPPYMAPCSADADCGPGFTCEEVEICQCGGAPMDPDNPDDPPMTDGECTCEPTGDTYCELVETECSSDADCENGLSCQEFPGGTVTCPVGEPCDQETEAPSYCAPEGYVYWGGPYVESGAGYGDTVASAAGHDNAETTSTQREEFFPVDGEPGSGDKQSPSACSTAMASGSGGGLFLFLIGLFALRRSR